MYAVLLDGFPRNVVQAEELDETLKSIGINLNGVINIVVPREKLVERATGRHICRACGASYHVSFKKPREEGICDNCGGELYQRNDDNETAVNNRLYICKLVPGLLLIIMRQGLLGISTETRTLIRLWKYT